MERVHDPNDHSSPVLCIACRRQYALRAVGASCPHCGCSSWIAARLVDRPPGTPATSTPG
jgi:hypothetical protein